MGIPTRWTSGFGWRVNSNKRFIEINPRSNRTCKSEGNLEFI